MKKLRRILLLIGVVVGVVIVAGLLAVKLLGLDRTVNAPIGKIPISAKDRVLIIAPHPDDETLGPGLLARQAVRTGAKVRAIIVTAGDAGKHAAQAQSRTLNPTPADYLRLGRTRHLESVAAMKLLGVNDVVFLAFADGSTNGLWRSNWDDKKPRPARNGNTAVPYDFAYDKGAVYSGNSLVTHLTAVIKEFNPTIILYPTAEDWHHDHWAVNAFTQYVLAGSNIKTREYTYLVHHGAFWPSPPLYRPQDDLQPPAGLSEIEASWMRYPVDEAARAVKLRAVRKYQSQVRLFPMWLESFVRADELFAVYPKETTKRVEKPPSFVEGANLPGVVIKDFEMSELSQKLGGKGDIRQFSFLYDKDFAYVAVDLKNPLPSDVVMVANMRFFTPSGVNRLDVRVANGTAKTLKTADNSVALPVTLVKNSTLVVIKVPASVMAGAKTMMLNVDTFRNTETEDAWLDRTVWRRIELN